MSDKTFRARILRKEVHEHIVIVSARDKVAAEARIIDGDYQEVEWLGRKAKESVDEISEIEED